MGFQLSWKRWAGDGGGGVPATRTEESSQSVHMVKDSNRRVNRRYQLRLELRYKASRRRQLLNSGAGKTSDLSSAGVAFDADEDLPTGAFVELSISWPVLLDQSRPLKLVIFGRILRSQERRIAVRTLRYEFRTAGGAPDSVLLTHR